MPIKYVLEMRFIHFILSTIACHVHNLTKTGAKLPPIYVGWSRKYGKVVMGQSRPQNHFQKEAMLKLNLERKRVWE